MELVFEKLFFAQKQSLSVPTQQTEELKALTLPDK
jgi:hypothetical protein